MIGQRDRELERRLQELRAPGEAESEERSWPVIREAYEQRTPVRPARRQRQLALALAGGLVVVAVGLSPAGAKVGDLVSDVVGVSSEDAKPELRSLPAAGEVLIENGEGTWIVRDDGSKRLLGSYTDAVWSPNGRFVAAASGSNLVALDPEGETEWTLPTEGAPSDIAWEGSVDDTRVAYRAGGDLYVVGGNGIGNHLVASDIGDAPPIWVEGIGVSKVDPAAGGFPYVLAFVESSGRVRVIAPDSGADVTLIGALPGSVQRALSDDGQASPVGERTAIVRRSDGRSVLSVVDGGKRRVVFTGLGRITEPVWSPDGRWLLFGWLEADQWVFLQPDPPRDVDGILEISEKFAVGAGRADFPRPRAWVLPDR